MSDTDPGAIPAQSRLKGLIGLAAVAVAIPILFWLGFGRIDGYAIAFTAFLVLIGLAVEFLPGVAEKAEQRLEGQPPVKPRWFDRLGVVWLLAIPFAPALTWMLRNGVGVDKANWTWLLGISAFFCVVVPLVCVLPLLRYVRRGVAGVSLLILAAGTAFPVMTGLGSAYDVIYGPQWQSVTITGLSDIDRMTGTGTRIQADAVFVDLADGRTLERAEDVPLRTGPARLLVLRGFGRIIDVE